MEVYIVWKYKSPKKPMCTFHSSRMNAKEAIVICEDLERTGRVPAIEFFDEREVTWSKKELTKLLKEIEDEPQDITIYFDGGFDRDEGISGLGIVVYYSKNGKLFRNRVNKQLIQLESNNEAEYAAMYESICILEELGVHHQTCEFKGDSHVVLNQLSGEWACFDDVLNRWLDRIEDKIKKMGIKAVYSPITRKENKEADSLATQALDGKLVNSTIQLEKKEEL